jgi:hypothetical protein
MLPERSCALDGKPWQGQLVARIREQRRLSIAPAFKGPVNAPDAT